MDFEQFFHNHCNVTDYTYKGVGEWEGWGGVGWGGVGWVGLMEVGYSFHQDCLEVQWVPTRSAGHMSKQA